MKGKTAFLAFLCIIGFTLTGCGGGGGGGSTAQGVQITTSTLPSAVKNQSYSAFLDASGGTLPYTWSATGLPGGLSLDASTGALSGTPTVDNAYSPVFTVRDNNGGTHSKTVPLVISPPPPPAIGTSSLPAGVRTQPYSAAVSVGGGTPPYSWSATGLPAGLNLNAATGAITGTPTAEGNFSPQLAVTDDAGLTDQKTIPLTIDPPPAPTIATSTLPSGVRTQAYSAAVVATSGTQPYTWSATDLPAGLSVNAATGAITGTPTEEGSFSPQFTVTDANSLFDQESIPITIGPPASPSITTSILPAGARTESYSASLAAAEGKPPYTWSATGLPPGVGINASTGDLSGTPTSEGSFTPLFTVTDDIGGTSQKPISLRIAKPLVLFVADEPGASINIFDNASVADGLNQWTRQIAGALTTMDNSVGARPLGLFLDNTTKNLYVARFSDNNAGGAVLAFAGADTANGNVSPAKVITNIVGSLDLASPADLGYDGSNDRLYVADAGLSSIVVFDNVSGAPKVRKLFGVGAVPVSIAFDGMRDILYVVAQDARVFAFDNVSDPSSPGPRTISITASAPVALVDMKIDTGNNVAYCTDYLGGRVFAINNASTIPSGPVSPDRTVAGLSHPNSLFPDLANDRLFVSVEEAGGTYRVIVFENLSSLSGTGIPSRQMSGFNRAAGMTGFYK